MRQVERGARRRIVPIVLCLSALVGMTIPAHALLNVDVPSLTFVVLPDPDFVGGDWLLTGFDEETELDAIDVATGLITVAGPLTVSIPLARLEGLTSAFFEWTAFRAIDDSSGIASTRGGGLAPWKVIDGVVIDLGVAHANRVPINGAADAVPTTAIGNDLNIAPFPWAPTNATSPDNPEPPSAVAATKPAATVLESATTDPQTTGIGPNMPPMYQCPYNPKCIDPENPLPGKPDQGAGLNCSFEGGATRRCKMQEQRYPMVPALRGFSQRPVGARTTFTVLQQAAVDWEFGVRYSSGPFSALGVVERGKTAGTEESWPLRGDCWEPARPGDDLASCDGWGGSRAASGTDPWVWERWRRESCPFGPSSCSYYFWEVLRQTAYGGGTQSGGLENLYYYELPSDIEAGVYGPFGMYPPNAAVKRFTLESERSYVGASFDIDSTGGWGRGTFNARMTNKTLGKIVNTVTFRSDIPWIHQWYRYDGGVDYPHWQREFFSCEIGPNWQWHDRQPCPDHGT